MENFSNFELGSLVVVIIAVVEAVKRSNVISNRFIPLVAVVLGVAGALYFGGVSWLAVAAGVFTSLASSGLYSSFKRTILNK